MWFSSWLRNRNVSPKRRPAHRFRPQLEVLEDRAVPATFMVNTTADVLGHDNGILSLRQAIIDANASPNADTIVLPAGTYKLALAGRDEDGALTGDLGGGIANFGTLTLHHSKVRHNSAPLGGDLYNAGLVSLFDSIIGVRYDI